MIEKHKQTRGLRRLRSGKSRTRTPYGGGKKVCTCGYRIRGKQKDHESGLHHQATKGTTISKLVHNRR